MKKKSLKKEKKKKKKKKKKKAGTSSTSREEQDGVGPGDPWDICEKCGVYRAFEGMSDACCRFPARCQFVQRGKNDTMNMGLSISLKDHSSEKVRALVLSNHHRDRHGLWLRSPLR